MSNGSRYFCQKILSTLPPHKAWMEHNRMQTTGLCSILPDTVQNTCVYKKSFALLYKIIAAVDANAGSSIFNDENFQFLMPVP